MKRALIIGGGPAGCAAAHQIPSDWDITIIEAGATLGAGLRTMWYGGHPYTFGPRHFLTKSEETFHYLNEIVPLRSCAGHRFWTYVADDATFYDFPIHRDDISRMPDANDIVNELYEIDQQVWRNPQDLEAFWIASVGPTLYRKFVREYSKKMWLVDDNRQIDTFNWSPKGVAIKKGSRAAWDTAISAYPAAVDGYDHYFDVATANATVRFNTMASHYDLPRRRVKIAGEWCSYDLIVSTISPDITCDFAYGGLHYVGREFHRLVLPVEYAMPPDVYFTYYAGQEKFTRVTEFKKFTGHRSLHTLLGIEIPVRHGRHYPLPKRAEMAKAARYHELFPENVFAMGRHGSYRYGVDFAACLEQAFELRKHICCGAGRGVLDDKWRLI